MPRTVLIVEDSPDSASLLEFALAPLAGLSMTVVPSAGDAMMLLSSSAGDGVCAVVTDLNMPRMDGYELIAAMRARPELARLPIIVVSADTDPDAPRKALRAGANAFFAKPYSPAEVRARLEELLNE
jgi:CheY-like chemotaxis protein